MESDEADRQMLRSIEYRWRRNKVDSEDMGWLIEHAKATRYKLATWRRSSRRSKKYADILIARLR